MLATWIWLSFLLWSCSAEDFPCGVPKIQHQATIKGGSNTKHGEWPWHAAIYQKEGRSYSYVCGGTLISEDFVLTAAHCLYNENTFQLLNRKRISVRLGVHNLDEINSLTTKEFPVQAMHMFSNFSRGNLRNDIALLELAEVAQFSDYILPACLNSDSPPGNLQSTSIGWGLTENDEISPVLKKVDLPIIDSLNCLISDRDYFGQTIDHNMFCAGHRNGTTVCNGDSGGGLFVKRENSWHLAGIVSFIKKRQDHTNYCSTESFAGFTNVTSYISWIKSITNIQVKDKSSSSFCGQRKQIRKFSVGLQDKTESKLVYNWPWHGALFRREAEGNVRNLCGVTILTKRTLLTAGFCVNDNNKTVLPATRFIVKVGLTEDIFGRTRFNQEHDVSKMSVREDSAALLQLFTEISFSEYVQPICLWKGDASLENIVSKTGHVITWKHDETTRTPTSSEEAVFEVISKSDCLERVPLYRNKLKTDEFCALFKNGTTTRGSGGAGLYMLNNDTWMIRGILAYGVSNNDALPLVFTDVSYYLTTERIDQSKQ